MSQSYLTDEEIADLTKPLKQGAARCKRFREMGITPGVRADGQPIVGRAEFEVARLRASGLEPAQQAQSGAEIIRPDFSALRRPRQAGVVR